MRRNHVILYVLIVLGFVLGIYFTIQAGRRLETDHPIATAAASVTTAAAPVAESATQPNHLFQGFRDNLREPLSRLLVQLLLIVVLARVFGVLAAKFGQPAVIGEMIAGIVLGPSLVGVLFPAAFQFIFPAESLGSLRMLSQVGVILFMFVVGMELDLKHLGGNAYTAVMVSQAGIIFPYFLGVVFSFFIFQAYGSHNAGFPAFALFMGIAMSVTAFPVLARILEERGLTKTQLGSTAIICAAVGDVSAWTILAFVVAAVKAGGPASSILTILLLLAFVAVMVLGVKPLLQRRLLRPIQSSSLAAPELHSEGGSSSSIPLLPTRTTIVGILVLVFAAGLFTEVIGIHALFGAFLAGCVMPTDVRFREHLAERLESFSSAFLLPLFFAFTGLRTQVGLLNDWQGVGVCLTIIGVATLGKLGGSMVVARWTGMNWHDSFALGALMNTRGLVELIVLNIGLDLGILSPRVFTMMVIMALVTTCLTGPLLSLGNLLRRKTPALAAAPFPANRKSQI